MAPSVDVALRPLPNMLIPLVALLLLLLASINPSDAQTGVCYTTDGTNLPSPQTTVSLFNQNNIKRVRIYDPNPDILQSLSNSNIQLMLGVPNSDLQQLAANQSNAATWIQHNVKSHPTVTFRYIVVGNEVTPKFNNPIAQFLLPALQNIQSAITQSGLAPQIKVSTAFDFGVLSSSSPPSAGKFDDRFSSFLTPIIKFIADNKAPLMVNVYPYYAYADAGSNVRLDYALFTARGSVLRDPQGGLEYQNLFGAMVDAVYYALEKVGAGSVGVVVSETGWPTLGGKDTTVENARLYNNNLIRSVKGGTPKRTGRELETYIFAMYNENKKKSPELARNWGLYNGMNPMYPINF